jgi:hypothetical protein
VDSLPRLVVNRILHLGGRDRLITLATLQRNARSPALPLSATRFTEWRERER